MDQDTRDQRLSRISTQWALLRQAHAGGAGAAEAAQSLLARYAGAAYRYLLAAVRDPDVAEELCQELALRFLRGDFHRASPERGRFRAYLKTVLVRLAMDYHRARRKQPCALPLEAAAAAAPPAVDEDAAFRDSWREELLECTWRALKEANADYHAALASRVEAPDLSSGELAEVLTARLGRPVNDAWVRKALQRAHTKFADLLLDEVACSLEGPTGEELSEELIALDLLRYCGSALGRWEARQVGRKAQQGLKK
jgi:RNA polymerase sigma-70 factor (ECF subfamily)